MTNSYFRLARRLFEKPAKEHLSYHAGLRRDLKKANIRMLADTYVSGIILTSLIISILTLILSFPLLYTIDPFGLGFGVFFVLPSLALGAISFAAIYLLMLIIPQTISRKREKDIEHNLPFALMHMSAVAASGVGPTAFFRLLTETDYGEASVEASKIVNYIDSFGLDITTAIRRVATNTPSRKFRELLTTINATILSGGDLKKFLYAASKNEIEEYKSQMELVSNKLGIAAEVYSVILISGPLLLFVGLSTMNMIWGTIGGVSIPVMISFGAYFLLPLVNLAFLLFLEVSQ